MYPKPIRRRTVFAMSAVLLLAASTTGCMTSPTEWSVYERTSSVIRFCGFVTEPGLRVELKALNRSTGRWEVFAESDAGTTLIENHNGKWYYWETHRRVPRHLWIRMSGDEPGRYGACIKAFAPGEPHLASDSMFTFETEFDPLDPRPLDQIWREHGFDRYIHIFAERR